ncbi:hypothetical protein FRC06_008527 [Ceratobasidium sp. 370]|nr:hypothetical protein FRC06_008527 [Ceratobasidium sp. 370]
MFLTRSFFNDFEPIFRIVQDTPGSYTSPAQRSNHHQHQAYVEVSEEPKEYIVRAELTDVQKENLDIHVGNDGRNVGQVYGQLTKDREYIRREDNVYARRKASEITQAGQVCVV